MLIFFSVEIILRAEAVEMAQAGDKCDFIGTLIVVPDVAQINMPGSKAETRAGRGNKALAGILFILHDSQLIFKDATYLKNA